MVDTEPPTKRIRYDFTRTFDVIVGKAQGRENRFPVYHDILTARSKYLRAARTAEPGQTVRLENEDPEVFSLYLNCVHSGMEAVRAGGELLSKHVHTASDGIENLVKRERDSEPSADESENNPDGGCFEALIRLHLLAGKLQDFEMMNSAIDELIRMVDEDGLIPAHVNLVYGSTKRGDTLRNLVRDVYIHEAESSECHELLKTSDLHSEFWRDISLEYFKLKDTGKSIGEVYGLKIGKDKGVNRCDYHQRKTDHGLEAVPPTTPSAAGAATVSMRNRAPVLSPASGCSSHRPTAAGAAPGIVAQGRDLAAPQTSNQSDRSFSLVATDERAPAVPQNSSLTGTKFNADSTAEQHDPAAPGASTRRPGRPSGTGNFQFRRPVTSDVWWSVSAERFDNAMNRDRYKYTNVGRAQEEGTVRAIPCDRCTRKGYGDTCSSLPGGRCGRCLWDKAAKGNGC